MDLSPRSEIVTGLGHDPGRLSGSPGAFERKKATRLVLFLSHHTSGPGSPGSCQHRRADRVASSPGHSCGQKRGALECLRPFPVHGNPLDDSSTLPDPSCGHLPDHHPSGMDLQSREALCQGAQDLNQRFRSHVRSSGVRTLPARRRIRAPGALFETFVHGELAKYLAAFASGIRLFHFRTFSGTEVDFILENRRGEIVAIEAKASTSLSS